MGSTRSKSPPSPIAEPPPQEVIGPMPPSPPRRPGRRNRRAGRAERPDATRSERPDRPLPRVGKDTDPLLGQMFDGHEVLERLGSDPVCVTYKAKHDAMERLVALKALSAEAAADEATVAQFYDTAKFAAQVHHPNIASIYDVSSAEDVHFCTMEYIEGRSVGELLRARQKIASDDAIRVAIDVGEALRFASARQMPGFRLSADRVILSNRGEVKVLPPTLTPPGAPVLDERYALTAMGALLYAMLSGGRVPDLEAALEPGSAAPAQLPRIKSAAISTRQDLAAVVDRLLGSEGAEPYANLDTPLAELRGLLERQEKVGTRTRTATERARERKKRGFLGIAAAVGAGVVFVAIIVFLLLHQRGRREAVRQEYLDAQAVANASIAEAKKLWTQFWNAPTPQVASSVVAHYKQARLPYERFRAAHPNTAQAQEAVYRLSDIDEVIGDLEVKAADRIRYLAERKAYTDLREAFEGEVAAKLKAGGKIDEPVWRSRYLKLLDKFPSSPYVEQRVSHVLRNLKAEIQRAEMKIATNQLINDFRDKYKPKHQYQKALDAWEVYRKRYDKIDAVRKSALTNCQTQTDMIKRDARVQFAQLMNHANFLAKEKKDYARAREIYRKIIDNFGIKRHVDKAKEALGKLPK